ncbi:hypothetical protein A9P82_08510 [Arachidicoccus ginsenosidimutans]|uniref:hypothetical protein n=1 Tax=Arachidicoccus sp. BS20 TaxID=1850526 RepID=UPI0007F10F4D|nr:hypothetical protein [Arachidicoccus sp. BS20]ANI89330.1 hypothetical protein A9P82_08510 [Arachidicoccus sp. BS20]
MEDLKNNTLYKFLWLPDEQEVVRLMKTEEKASSIDIEIIIENLKKHINISTWYKEYAFLYHEWLNNDINTIYDIYEDINESMISAIKKVNKELIRYQMLLFYWFDIDRTLNENWIWKEDPFSHNKLFLLDASYKEINRKVSLENFIVFPATSTEF